MKTKFPLLVLFVLQLAFASQAFAATADTYQVTGPVIALTDSTIVVEKNHERWELARDAKTKGEAGLKVGDKVTVHYRMLATSIEVKPADAKAPAAETAGPTKKSK
ncbi:MAG: hypothetical protein ABIZ04_09315 [Opitutus sp.]